MATRKKRTTTQALIRDLHESFGTTDDQGHDIQDISISKFLVKIIPINYTRTGSPDIVEAKGKEIEGMSLRKLWNVVNKSDIQNSASVLCGQFINTLRIIGTQNEAA